MGEAQIALPPAAIAFGVYRDTGDEAGARNVYEKASAIVSVLAQDMIPIKDGKLQCGNEGEFRLGCCPDDAVAAVHYGDAVLLEESGDMRPVSMYIVSDKSGVPLGSFCVDETKETIVVISHREALKELGEDVPSDISESAITEYFIQVPMVFGGIQRSDVPVAVGIRALEARKMDPEAAKAVDEFIRTHSDQGLFALSLVTTEKELHSLVALGKLSEHESDIHGLLAMLQRLSVNTAELTGVGKKVDRLGHAFFQQVLEHWQDHGFPWDAVRISVTAFDDLLAHLYQIPFERQIPDDAHGEQFLRKYHAENSEALDLFWPILEERWVRAAQNVSPDEYQKAAAFFYEAMRETLSSQASETTGDTKLEQKRYTAIVSALSHTWRDWTLIDTGTGDGERILRPLLEHVKEIGQAPGCVVAVDLLPYENPQDGAWEQVAADFSKPEFVQKIREKVNTGPRVLLNTWSPLADVGPNDQLRALMHFSEVLQAGDYCVIDVPAGYLAEIEAYHQAHPTEPYGTIEKTFLTKDGIPVAKKFYIAPMAELVARAEKAGFTLLNRPGLVPYPDGVPALYETGKGNLRWTMILQKVRDPDQAIALLINPDALLVGDSRAPA